MISLPRKLRHGVLKLLKQRQSGLRCSNVGISALNSRLATASPFDDTSPEYYNVTDKNVLL